MAALDVGILFAFIVYAMASGLRHKKQASQNLEEYFLAGRSLPGWKAGLSMAATQFAADTPLLVTGIIATTGIFGLWQLWSYGLAFLLMGFVLAGSWRRAGVITDAELTELRYGGKPAAVLRGVKAVYFGTVFNCTVLAWVFLATARIAEPFLHWDRWLPPWMFDPVVRWVQAMDLTLTLRAADDSAVWLCSANNLISILVIVAITTFYSTTGGLRSVVATDVGQLGVMLAGTLLFTVVVVGKVGGLEAIQDQLQTVFAERGATGITSDQILAFTPDRAKDASPAILLLFAVQWLIQLNADGTGYLAQRAMACRDPRQSKIAAIVFTFVQILLRSLLWLPLGVGLLVLFPPDLSLAGSALQADREGTFVRGMSELLPSGIMGLMLTGMFAALASTVDTHINWGSSYWTNDIYRRFICQALLKKEPSGPSLVWVARGSNVLIVCLSLVIMTQLTSINEAWQLSLLLGAGMGVVLILRWLWWRMNAWAELAAIVASMVAAPVLLWQVDDTASRLVILAILATTAAVAAIYIAGPEDLKRLAAFYERVRPPGFWQPVAQAVQEQNYRGPQRLRRSASATLAAGTSLFCLLVGLGSWLVGSPPPRLFPWPLPWYLLNVGVGLALCPTWIRLGFGDSGETDLI